jgi:heme/copper-type cytochrome/quinol oxidase subunit 1
MFSIGGSTGIILSTNVMDIALHDSYFVVSHFHMVLSLGSINGLLCGIYMLQDHLLSYFYISSDYYEYHLLLRLLASSCWKA